MSRPIGVELFSGAGGMSLGFEQAGFDVVAAVEIDPVHCAVHEFNFPDCKIIAKSVNDVDGEFIRQAANIGDQEVDVVFGGAPCQGFSMIGQRALDDPRNQLVKDFVRLVVELNAKYFVFENVKGITVGKHKKFLKELVEEFESHGYSLITPWQVLNAHDYGVPQSRERLFLVGSRKDVTPAKYPQQQTRRAGNDGALAGVSECPTVEEALGDLPNADDYEELLKSDSVKALHGKASNYAAWSRGLREDPLDYSYPRKFKKNLLTSSLRTKHSEVSAARFFNTPVGKNEPVSRFFRLHPDGVSNTLRAGTDSARGAHTSPRPIHYKHPRCITVREMARLHSFPDWFRLHVTKWHGARQVGNAVPALLARAVASELISAMGIKLTKPERVLSLGSETLLSMGMTAASQYYSIDVPIAQRKRKTAA